MSLFCDAVRAGRSEPSRVVSAVWYQPDDWLSAAGALASGRQGGSGEPLAAAATLARAQLDGDGKLGAGGARRAPRLGWAQDRSPAAGSEAPGGAERQHDYRDIASPWPHRACGRYRPQTV